MAADLYGLLIKDQTASLPLKDVSVSSFVQGYLLGVQSVLKYENDGPDPVEVLFRTPVDDSHAVVGLEAVIDGRRIRAEIKGKEEARAEYDDAMASGRTAAYGEEMKGDIFSLALGNLPPGKEAEIHLTMVGELEIDAEGSIRFVLPTVLKPRYTPAWSEDPLVPVAGAEIPAGQIRRTKTPSVYEFDLSIAGMEHCSWSQTPHSLKPLHLLMLHGHHSVNYLHRLLKFLHGVDTEPPELTATLSLMAETPMEDTHTLAAQAKQGLPLLGKATMAKHSNL